MVDNEFAIGQILKDYPQFRHTTNRMNEEGWDNLVYIANEQVVFRIPRHEPARAQLQVELHYLPKIAQVSPVPVPDYRYFSSIPGLYAGYDLLPGIQLTPEILDTCSVEQRKQIARQIGEFLSALHDLPLSEMDLQTVPLRKQTRQTWQDLRSEVYQKASAILSPQHRRKNEQLFAYILDEIDFDALPKGLIHGDFSADHILFDEENKRISGVIDFGDLMIGDPAYDFTGILMAFEQSFFDKGVENYSLNPDEHFMNRIKRFYNQKVPLHQVLFGVDQQDKEIIAEGLEKFA